MKTSLKKNNYRFELTPIEKLHTHEQFKPERLKNVEEKIRQSREVDLPVLADEKTYVIIDGHHRYWSCKHLGCAKVPVVLVDYMDDAIVSFSVRPESPFQGIQKKDIIAMGLSENTYPFKTTKHKLLIKTDTIPISLEVLNA